MHNPKVVGSNPTPATTIKKGLTVFRESFFYEKFSADWSQVNIDGFGDTTNSRGRLAVHNNRLYVGTGDISGPGAEVWRCSICDGSDWSQVNIDGFGDAKRVCLEYGRI